MSNFLELCGSGTADAVAAALLKGENPNTVSTTGCTALLLGVENTADVVAALLAAGADPGKKGPKGNTPLMIAIRAGGPDAEEKVRLLLEAGAAVDERNDKGETALMRTTARGVDTAVAALLLEAGADVNARSDIGTTALLLACAYGSPPSLIRLLLQAGADAKTTTDYGVTALVALNYNSLKPEEALEIFPLILHAGAEVNILDDVTKNTPLINAAKRRAPPEIVAWLLEAGADVNLKAEDSYSAIEWACWKGVYPEVAAMLIGAGAVYDREYLLAMARDNVYTGAMVQVLEKIA